MKNFEIKERAYRGMTAILPIKTLNDVIQKSLKRNNKKVKIFDT